MAVNKNPPENLDFVSGDKNKSEDQMIKKSSEEVLDILETAENTAYSHLHYFS